MNMTIIQEEVTKYYKYYFFPFPELVRTVQLIMKLLRPHCPEKARSPGTANLQSRSCPWHQKTRPQSRVLVDKQNYESMGAYRPISLLSTFGMRSSSSWQRESLSISGGILAPAKSPIWHGKLTVDSASWDNVGLCD